MTKMITPLQRNKALMRAEVYKEWKSLKRRGYSKRTAMPELAEIFGKCEGTIALYILQEERSRGEAKAVVCDRERYGMQAWKEWKKMEENGWPKMAACYEIGKKYGKCAQTIYNWLDRMEKESQRSEEDR